MRNISDSLFINNFMGKMKGICDSPADTETQSIRTKYVARLDVIRQMLAAYVAVLAVILLVAFLNLKYPSLGKRLLRNDVGVVAFVCFISIQAAFELETERSVSQAPGKFYAKAAVYVLDLCVLVNARAKPGLVISTVLFALCELAHLYHAICTKYTASAADGKKAVSEEEQYRSVGTLMIVINVVALLLAMGKDTLFHLSPDVIKTLLAVGLAMLYIDVGLRRKLVEFMETGDPRHQANLVFSALRLVRPLVTAALTRFKTMKKIK